MNNIPSDRQIRRGESGCSLSRLRRHSDVRLVRLVLQGCKSTACWAMLGWAPGASRLVPIMLYDSISEGMDW